MDVLELALAEKGVEFTEIRFTSKDGIDNINIFVSVYIHVHCIIYYIAYGKCIKTRDRITYCIAGNFRGVLNFVVVH